MASKKESEPFYMTEVDSDVPVLPQGAALAPEDIPEDAQFVDIGTIETNPKINYSQYESTGKGLASFARIGEDGRIVISIDLKKKLPDLPKDYAKEVQEFGVDEGRHASSDVPAMNIVIMIVGSRGDVQPYVALGKLLKKDGHRIRIATHETFRSFVTDSGLEFFCIGGDPQELMSYMVKNPGLMPGMDSLTNGDIGRKRTMLSEMINGCWKSCYEPDDVSGSIFAADAIISNPPAFAHVHCAEALGIPLLLSFTMPWSPTTAFPHPLVNVKQSNAERGLTNYLSYALADLLTWQGIGDLVNDFRTKTLGLRPLSITTGPGLVDRLKVPWTYCMSPALVPPPKDWKNHIDVVGFYFLDLATDYTPANDLAKFLADGPPPVYIGFGSVVVEDSAAMTEIIFQATANAGVRALVSAGWGGLGGVSIPDHIFILGNVPHDWLFERVAAVVHHGGAGTTAIGLKKGCPTVVVPFFGDQPFWGSMINKAGAGPEPIPQKNLNAKNLCDALKFAVSPSAKTAAKQMGQQIEHENGVQQGVESFYRHLPLLNMRCDLDPTRLAVWWSTEHCMKLSAFAAQTLSDAKLIDMKKLDTHRTKEYDSRRTVTDPVSGGASAIFWTITNYYTGIGEIFFHPVKGIIKTTTAIPRGVVNIVGSVQQGFHNAPKLYGSSIREPGAVTDFSSGIKEGAKGIFYGYYDGITGLVREPVEGAKKEGVLGAIKGSARSFVNVTMKPAAGILGAIAHPAEGAWKTMQKSWAREQEDYQRKTRISDGVGAVKGGTKLGQNAILTRFKNAKPATSERKKKYKDMAEKEMYIDDTSRLPERTYTGSTSSPTTDVKPPLPPRTYADSTAPPSYADSKASMSSSSGSDTTAQTSAAGQDDDAAFERDLELAKQLSLAEQRGYERGLASAK